MAARTGAGAPSSGARTGSRRPPVGRWRMSRRGRPGPVGGCPGRGLLGPWPAKDEGLADLGDDRVGHVHGQGVLVLAVVPGHPDRVAVHPRLRRDRVLHPPRRDRHRGVEGDRPRRCRAAGGRQYRRVGRGTASPGFLDSWGSGYVQGRYPGRAWTSGGPNLPTYQPALPNGVLDNGGAMTISAPAAATAVRRLDVNADVVMVNPAAGAAGRISLGADRGRPARHHHGQLRRASIQPLTTGGPRSSPPGSGCRTATFGAACAGTSWSPVERPRRRRLGRRRCRLRRRPGRGDSGRGSNQR